MSLGDAAFGPTESRAGAALPLIAAIALSLTLFNQEITHFNWNAHGYM